MRATPCADLGHSLLSWLDTVWLMGLSTEYEQGLAWVSSLQPSALTGAVSIYQVITRLIGGLTAMHSLTQEPVFLHRAVGIADKCVVVCPVCVCVPCDHCSICVMTFRECECV